MSRSVSGFIRSNIVGFVALFVALSAGAYAIETAPRNSVISKSIKNRQVKTKDLANGAVRDIKVAPDGLTSAAIDEAALDGSILQRRVAGDCAAGAAIRQIAVDGTVTCEGVGGGGSPTGPASGDLTGSYPAPQIAANAVDGANVVDNSLSGADVDESTLDRTSLQSRVTGTCAAGQAIGQVAQDGSVTCRNVGSGTVTQVNTGFGLSGGPITTTGTIAVDDAAVQRRVTGSCESAIRAIAQNGTVTCGPEIRKFHLIWQSGGVGAPLLYTTPNFSLLGLCHGNYQEGDATITGTKVIFGNNDPDTGATLNWLYGDGTAFFASGAPIPGFTSQKFDFQGKRIEGQFIYTEAETDAVITVNLHAYDGGTFCEFTGTVTRVS